MSINLAGDVAPHDTDADMPTLPPGDPRQAYWDEWAIGKRFVPLHAKEREDAGEEMTLDGVTSMLLSTNLIMMQLNADRILEAMRLVADPAQYPLVFGCMTGKDRTGLVAALTLGALGATREAIMADYLKSNDNLEHNFETLLLRMERNRESQSDEDMLADVTPERLRVMVHVTQGVMDGTLDWIEEHHGDVRGYLASIGFGEADVQRLADNLLEPKAAL